MVILVFTVWNPLFLEGVTGSSNTIANITSSNSLANSTAVNTITSLSSQVGKSVNSSLITIPLGTLPAVMLATPIILLFVYDKNNGMLEYFLSLGMRQTEIYTSYLKAALLLIAILLIIMTPIYIAVGYLYHMPLLSAEIMALMIPMSFVNVSFMMVSMFAFSTLQKTRTGSNQPIGMLLGVAWILPGILLALLLPASAAVIAELALIAVVGLLTLTMLRLSGKLINREKLLPG